MNEETQQIEIDFTNSFAVMLEAEWIAVFPTQAKAEWFAELRQILDKTRGHTYTVKQITRKVDFAKVNEALKVRGLV